MPLDRFARGFDAAGVAVGLVLPAIRRKPLSITDRRCDADDERRLGKHITVNTTNKKRSLGQRLGLAIGFIAPMAVSFTVFGTDVKVTLSGDQEVPPVATNAKGSGTLTFGTDKSVAGSVATTGIAATAAHIHEAAPGKNGGVIVPLIKGADGRWIVPAGAKLTDAQEASLLAGNLYVNVHSDAHKDGEIRGQIKP